MHLSKHTQLLCVPVHPHALAFDHVAQMLTHALARDALINAPVCPDGQLDGDERGGLGRESKRLVRLADVVVGREAEDELGVGRTRLMCRVQEGVQGKECCAEDVIGGEDLRALV